MVAQTLFQLSEIKSHLNFSINVFFFGILNFFSRRSDVLLIGKFLGAEQVGLYMMAYDFIMKPLSQIMSIFSKTIFPLFSEYQKDLKKVRRMYLRLTHIMLIVIAPILILSAIVAPLALPLILGAKWIHAVNIFQVVCVGAVFTVLGSPVGNIFLAQGRPDLQWKFSLFFATPLILAGLSLGYYFGRSAFGVAIGYNIALGIILIPGFLLAFSIINLKLLTFYNGIKNIINALFIMLVTAVPFYLLFYDNKPLILVLLTALLPIASYFLFLYKYEVDEISYYKKELLQLIKK